MGKATTVENNHRFPPGLGDSAPYWIENRPSVFGCRHPGGANIAFADGSVQDGIALPQLRALSTRDGDEVVELP